MTTLQEVIAYINSNLTAKTHKVIIDESGKYQWTVPQGVQQIFVTAIAGGASGTGYKYVEKFNAPGEDTLFKDLVLKGGAPDEIPIEIDENNNYSGGIGEDSPFGEGGRIPNSEYPEDPNGKGYGSGGAGVTDLSFSTNGGGAGEFVINKEFIVSPGEVIDIVIGEGGSVNYDIEDPTHQKGGNGKNGMVEILYTTISFNNEETVAPIRR